METLNTLNSRPELLWLIAIIALKKYEQNSKDCIVEESLVEESVVSKSCFSKN